MGKESTGSEESVTTVVVAGVCNLGIAAAKALAGLVSGSSAMLSEAAHSFADTVTELLLFTSLKRGERPADAAHPFGHGRERYLWALIASVATFVGGAVFSVYDGIHTLTHGEELGDPALSYVVLGVAFVLESVSLARTVRQLEAETARLGVGWLRFLRHTADTALKAVFLEDSAALVGLLLAFGGLLGSQLSGSGAWDGTASVLIGLLLAWVAYVLARDNVSLLLGRALPGPLEERLVAVLRDQPHVVEVLDLATSVFGPDDILVAAKVHFADLATAAEIEQACDTAELSLRTAFPAVTKVYLDPTPSRAQSS
ncbi:cation diffusion facilitator family transporter [Kitasatospora sp. NPDC048365]|uniref:cation diffusion facilitator family transporter n=1 Tax=Kitasatospora sp. NPDC048365 TaxID=3364050 RepID=UPI00371627BF